MSQAQADVDIIASRIRERFKRDRTFTISVVPMLDQVVGNVRRSVLVLLGAVGLVLLIACANVANLLLARAAARQKEVAIRTALGAGWTRMVRQLLTESVLLGLLGGAAGLLLALGALYLMRRINPGDIPRVDEIGISGGVLTFTFAISILTGVVFGLVPAFRAVKVDLNSTLKSGGRTSQSGGGLSVSRDKLRGLLAITEIALSLMLLVGAGLLIRSFVRLLGVSPGFNPDHVLSLRLSLTDPKYKKDEAARVRFFSLMRARGSKPCQASLKEGRNWSFAPYVCGQLGRIFRLKATSRQRTSLESTGGSTSSHSELFRTNGVYL